VFSTKTSNLIKGCPKLIFINVGFYGRSSGSYFQILKPHKVKELLKVKEHLLRAMVKPPRTSKKGEKE